MLSKAATVLLMVGMNTVHMVQATKSQVNTEASSENNSSSPHEHAKGFGSRCGAPGSAASGRTSSRSARAGIITADEQQASHLLAVKAEAVKTSGAPHYKPIPGASRILVKQEAWLRQHAFAALSSLYGFPPLDALGQMTSQLLSGNADDSAPPTGGEIQKIVT
jgi:hypothetical protein